MWYGSGRALSVGWKRTMECVKHPEREARLYCQKTNRWFCEECGSGCASLKAHCKFRTACIIWALEHDRSGSLREEASDDRRGDRE